MDDENAGQKQSEQDLECRPPLLADVVALCRELNQRQARYIVIGGFAIIAAGLPRMTVDIDLLVAADPENEQRLFSALSTLHDNAASHLKPGELQHYTVIRIADEFMVDILVRVGGIDYAQAAKDLIVRTLDGVAIPFASPRLLWRMKSAAHRARDKADLDFLRHWFEEHGQEPPS